MAMTEANGQQLLVSDSSKKLYIFNETTYTLSATLTGFSSNIYAMSASADGLFFAASVGSTFSYYSAATSGTVSATLVAQNNADSSNTFQISMMDRWGTVFFTGDDANGIWWWNMTQGGLITNANFYNSYSYNWNNFITCLNGTRK
jgi:hypothetical protein